VVNSNWGITPRQSIEAECTRRGRAEVLAGCIDLLAGRHGDDELILALGGPGAPHVLAGGAGGRHGYWPRALAARGLLYVWDDAATPVIIHAMRDDAWRVREMAAKVIAKHRVGEALDAVSALRDDDVARVRAAAERAVVRITAVQA